MITFLAKNIGTIIVLLIVAAVVIAVSVKMIKDKKAGKSACGGDCSKCHGGCSHSQ
ncbi:MAG: FeoB-associated Cys-rich membrane protein [Clostridium sp.]|nr:FeoB-associated Cys-rich membrane protein [Clostridium sp.]